MREDADCTRMTLVRVLIPGLAQNSEVDYFSLKLDNRPITVDEIFSKQSSQNLIAILNDKFRVHCACVKFASGADSGSPVNERKGLKAGNKRNSGSRL